MSLDPHASCKNRNKEIEAAFDDEGVAFESIIEGTPLENFSAPNDDNWDLFSDIPDISVSEIPFDSGCIQDIGRYTMVV